MKYRSCSQTRLFALALLLLFGFVATTRSAAAYPTFIGYGYTSCQVCHFNSFGNGPLTDYGRALGASTIAAKGIFHSDKSDEELALASGFLGSKQLPGWIRPAVDFRGLAYFPGLETSDSSRNRIIPMQADMSLTLQSASRKHWGSVTLGYLPDRQNSGKANESKGAPLISREHYVSLRALEKTRVMVGMMDIPFGIRIPDHTAYSRSSTLLKQNDQSHQVTVHQYGEGYELGISAIAGNLFQDADLQQRGVSLFAEYDLFDKVRVGHSNLYTTNEYRSRLMNAIHARIGTGEGSAFLVEAGLVSEKTKIPSDQMRSYLLFENMIRFARGLHFLIIGEYKTLDTFKSSPRTLRVGPAIQYFPMNRVELRSDFQITRVLNSTTVEKDTMDLLVQLHLWF